MSSSSLWRKAGPLVVGRGVSAIIGFTLPIILARRLDASEYGSYKQVYLVANLAMYCLQLGLAQSLFYFVPRASSDAERRTFIAQTQLILSLIGVATFAGLLLGTPFIAVRFSNPDLQALSVPLALLSGALVASSAFEIALTARGRPQWSAAALIATDLLRISAMLAAIELGYGLPGLVWAAALSAMVRWVASLALAGSAGVLTLDRAHLRTQLAYSLPFGVAVLLLQQQMQMHQVFISTHATPALFALYAVGCMQIPIVSLLYAPVSETLQVQLASLERTGETHRAGEAFSDAVARLASVFLPLCAVMIVTARPMLHVLYRGRYDDAASVLRIAVLSVAASSLPVDGVLKARARTGLLLGMYAAKLAITWPLLALGYRFFGLEGAIGAHVLVELITKASQVLVIAWDLKLPAWTLLGGKALLHSTLVAVTAGGVCGAAVLFIPRAIWACAAGGVLAAVVVGADFLLSRRALATPVVEPLRQAA
jgi:O-antigen/teichoic acid export membrane protein